MWSGSSPGAWCLVSGCLLCSSNLVGHKIFCLDPMTLVQSFEVVFGGVNGKQNISVTLDVRLALCVQKHGKKKEHGYTRGANVFLHVCCVQCYTLIMEDQPAQVENLLTLNVFYASEMLNAMHGNKNFFTPQNQRTKPLLIASTDRGFDKRLAWNGRVRSNRGKLCVIKV